MNATTSFFAAAIGALALAGCTDPAGQQSSTRTGAMMGALGGGILGATTGRGDRTLETVVGAAIGAGLGGAVGSTLDKQAAELRQDISTPGVGIVNTGDSLVVTMPEAITFATDSALVSSSAQRDLASVAANLGRYGDSTIQVVGHTDSTGTMDYNMALSQRRAASVAAILINNSVARGRIATSGRGPNQPVASNTTVDGRAANRRVEIVIRPNQLR